MKERLKLLKALVQTRVSTRRTMLSHIYRSASLSHGREPCGSMKPHFSHIRCLSVGLQSLATKHRLQASLPSFRLRCNLAAKEGACSFPAHYRRHRANQTASGKFGRTLPICTSIFQALAHLASPAIAYAQSPMHKRLKWGVGHSGVNGIDFA